LKRAKSRGAPVAAAHDISGFPKLHVPVVALVGRSNVGKSSLLNRLLKTDAARVGRTPGKTRGIYFYENPDQTFLLADLPGAGFARVSQAEREGWARLAGALFARGEVRLAVRLVDSRVPDAAVDRQIREYLEALSVPTVVVAGARRRLEAVHGPVRTVSSKTGEGIDALRREILVTVQRKKDNAHA
jgi:GTP-binding protein